SAKRAHRRRARRPADQELGRPYSVWVGPANARGTDNDTKPMNPIPRLKSFSGPALLSYGFRPFFLLGAIYAGLGILIWLPMFFGEIAMPTAFSPRDWHIHEMLYGYLPTVITGFLLTAIPNWTGRLPLQGGALAGLVTVWIAGRIAVCISVVIGPLASATVDVLFLLLVASAI